MSHTQNILSWNDYFIRMKDFEESDVYFVNKDKFPEQGNYYRSNEEDDISDLTSIIIKDLSSLVSTVLTILNFYPRSYEGFRDPFQYDPKVPKIDLLQPLILYYKTKDLLREGIEPNPGPYNRSRRPNRRQNRRRNQDNMLQQRPGLIMPPRYVADFMFVDSAYVRNNPGNNYLVYSFRINDLYDPDPLLLSGSVSGFKEMMQFYDYYRVLGFKAAIQISNNEAIDIFYGAVFSQNNLTGTIASRDDAANALENNFAKGPFLLSEKTGMDRASMTLSIRPSSLLGVQRQYFADLSYAGTGLATPSIPLWLNFIVYTPSGAALTNGYTTATKLFFHAEFFGRINLRA